MRLRDLNRLRLIEKERKRKRKKTQEKKTALGSKERGLSETVGRERKKRERRIPVGRPSAPIPLLANFWPIKMRRASSKLTLRRFMICSIWRLAATSRPDRESPDSMLSDSENASELVDVIHPSVLPTAMVG